MIGLAPTPSARLQQLLVRTTATGPITVLVATDPTAPTKDSPVMTAVTEGATTKSRSHHCRGDACASQARRA